MFGEVSQSAVRNVSVWVEEGVPGRGRVDRRRPARLAPRRRLGADARVLAIGAAAAGRPPVAACAALAARSVATRSTHRERPPGATQPTPFRAGSTPASASRQEAAHPPACLGRRRSGRWAAGGPGAPGRPGAATSHRRAPPLGPRSLPGTWPRGLSPCPRNPRPSDTAASETRGMPSDAKRLGPPATRHGIASPDLRHLWHLWPFRRILTTTTILGQRKPPRTAHGAGALWVVVAGEGRLPPPRPRIQRVP
jgi:hypothetical protein